MCWFQSKELADAFLKWVAKQTNKKPQNLLKSLGTWRIIPASKWLVNPIYRP